MKVYIDFLFFLNFGFDFLLLLSVSYLLKRNISLKKLCIGALIGALSILFLFFPLNSFTLFLLKVAVSILMIFATFGYQSKRYFIKNILYLYLNSIVLGGALYFLNVQFSMKQKGLIFFHNGLSINVLVLFFASPVIIYVYVKQLKELKTHYSNYYEVSFSYQSFDYHMTAFLDTGNQIKDPYMKRPVILMNKSTFKTNIRSPIYIPYHAVGHDGMLTCLLLPEIDIKGVGVRKKVLLGFMEEDIKIDGVEMLLQQKVLEG
ncbi:MAG: sigma-E processing peptidase SpoIIGA [Firmicutes bacterium]|nr:sigma-E processing peptidase SpoIIGA [Bacillota bacterium]